MADDWPALRTALDDAAAAVQEQLLRAAFFRDPWLVQWRFSAPLLARARARMAAAAARPPPEYPGVSQVGSSYNWKLKHGGRWHRGSAPTARDAALGRDEAMRCLGVDKEHWIFNYDGGLPVLNSARVPRGSAGVNFELHAAAGLPPPRSQDCQNPHGCQNRATRWYQAQLALCKRWCAAGRRAHETGPPDALFSPSHVYVTDRKHPGTHRTPEAAEAGRFWNLGRTFSLRADDESADEAEEALEDDENDQTYGEQGAAKRPRVLSDDCVADAVLAVCRPVRRSAALNPIPADAPPRSAGAQLMRLPRTAVAVAHLLQGRSAASREILRILDALGAAIHAARSAPGAAELAGRDFLALSEGVFTDPRDSSARPYRLLAIDQEGPGTALRTPFLSQAADVPRLFPRSRPAEQHCRVPADARRRRPRHVSVLYGRVLPAAALRGAQRRPLAGRADVRGAGEERLHHVSGTQHVHHRLSAVRARVWLSGQAGWRLRCCAGRARAGWPHTE